MVIWLQESGINVRRACRAIILKQIIGVGQARKRPKRFFLQSAVLRYQVAWP
jgi:hypothetical protein